MTELSRQDAMRVLLQGIAPVPPIPEDVRAAARAFETRLTAPYTRDDAALSKCRSSAIE